MGTRMETQRRGQTQNSYQLLVEYFKFRPDIGFGRMLLDVALVPRNPFKPWERRKPKKGFVAATLFLLAALAWFVYFSLAQ
jgi:hypothetical protein